MSEKRRKYSVSYQERELIKTRVISNANLSSRFLDMAICDHGLERWGEGDSFMCHGGNEYRSIKRLTQIILCYVLIPGPASSDIYPSISTAIFRMHNFYTTICPDFANMIYILFPFLHVKLEILFCMIKILESAIKNNTTKIFY